MATSGWDGGVIAFLGHDTTFKTCIAPQSTVVYSFDSCVLGVVRLVEFCHDASNELYSELSPSCSIPTSVYYFNYQPVCKY